MIAQDLKDFVVVPTLKDISEFIPFSESAVNLLLGTAAQESQFNYLDQLGSGPGPAYGLFQMERTTHDSHKAWLKQKPKFYEFVQTYQIMFLDDCTELHGNLYYATILARIHYWRVAASLPAASDVLRMAHYWKQHYNTFEGSGTVSQFVANYQRLVTPLR